MTSAIGVSSSRRSGSVSARASGHAPIRTSAAPRPPATRPRSGNGRNWSVIALITVWAIPPGCRSGVTWRITCATPSASRSRPRNMSRSQRLTPIPGWSQRRSLTEPASRPSFAPELAVEHLDRIVPLVAQPLGELLREHDRTVAAAGAADADREPALALVGEGGNAELEQLVDQVHVLARAGLGQHEFADRLGQAGQLAQLRDVVRVLDEARVEDEVGLQRDPELVAEADQLDRHAIGLQVADAREQSLLKLAQRQVGRIDDDVGLGADRVEQAALEGDGGLRAPPVRERVPMARLGEAPDDGLVARLEEEHLRPDTAALQRATHPAVGGLGVAGAHV